MERPRPSISDFLTDGSLAALCGALSQMTGVRVTLHDERGRRIVRTDLPSGHSWRVEEQTDLAPLVAAAIQRASGAPDASAPITAGPDSDPLTLAPLCVKGVIVGALVIHGAGEVGERLREVVRLLGSTVNELFEADVDLERRSAELHALFRLSSQLVAARELSAVLDPALRAVVDNMPFDAAYISLLNEEDGQLFIRATLGAGTIDAPDDATLPSGFAHSAAWNLTFGEQRIGVLRLFARVAPTLSKPEQALLRTIIEQVAAAVTSVRLFEAERRARQVQRQLQLAADVQRRLLPAQAPVIPGLDISARYIPSLELAGDFYDLIDLGGHLGIAVGDVAGKGAPAAILMASVRSVLRAHATEVYHLDDIIARVNRAMTRDTLPNEFATLFYGVIDPRTLRLTYCSAGHDPTYLLRLPAGRAPEDCDLHALDIGGTVIGIDASQVYQRGMFDLAPGDTLVAYTDGLVDARNFEQQRFGRPRLRRVILDAVRADPAAAAQKIADHLIWEVRRFVGLNTATDDMTVLVIRVTHAARR